MIGVILWAITITGGLLILAMCRDAAREIDVTTNYFRGERP